MKIVSTLCLSLALLISAAARAEPATGTSIEEDRSPSGGGGGLRGSQGLADEEDPHRHLFEPGASVARVWVKYKKGKKRSECVQSLKSLVIASGAAGDDTTAQALVTPDKDKPHFGTKSFTGTTPPLQMHYEFFAQQSEAVVATVDKNMLSALAADPNVISISKDEKRYFYGTKSRTPLTEAEHRELQTAEVIPSGVKLVQADSVWALGYKGTGVKVCVIDSGIDKGHPEYSALTMTGVSTGAGTWSTDGLGHGTHCAGTIAARQNGLGVVGVAPEATLIPVRVFNAAGSYAYASSVADAAVECQKLGANIVSMSLGGPGKDAQEEALFNTLHSQGVVNIAAAGNEGDAENYLSYPASYAVVLSVAAVNDSKVRAAWSQYNSLVDVSAPGVSVLSSVPRASVTTGYPYEKWDGTSMATPHVAGVAALLRQKNPTASATAIMNAITSTAQDLGTAGKDIYYGYGFVRALNAINALAGGTTPKPPTKRPTKAPTKRPTKAPTRSPAKAPTKRPTKKPTRPPTKTTTKAPTKRPTKAPTKRPTKAPTRVPTTSGTKRPTKRPTRRPTFRPTFPTCDDYYYYC